MLSQESEQLHKLTEGTLAGTNLSTHSTTNAQHLSAGLALPNLNLPTYLSRVSNTSILRSRGSDRRRRASTSPPSPSSSDSGQQCDDGASVPPAAGASPAHVKPTAGSFAEAINLDLRRHGLDLTAPRRARPPPRDRSGTQTGPQACGTSATAVEVRAPACMHSCTGRLQHICLHSDVERWLLRWCLA